MSAESEAAAELAAAQAGGGSNDVEIIEPSPTCLDPNKMPKTVESNVFTCAKNQAYSSRVRISKLLVQCNSKVKDLANEGERFVMAFKIRTKMVMSCKTNFMNDPKFSREQGFRLGSRVD